MSCNINKKAGVELNGWNYRLVQGDSNLAIWRRKPDGSYEFFGEAGPQKEIDRLAIDEKRRHLRERILRILEEREAK